MEYQLQDLIDRIKKDGFEASESEAQRKLQEAEEKSGRLLQAARLEAESLREKAGKEAALLVESGKEALRQAARDISLTLEQDLRKQFSALLEASLAAAFKQEVMEEAILSVATSWKGLVPGASVHVSPELSGKLVDSLKGKLADLARKGLTIKASPRVKAGFRLVEADGSAYYDFTAATMTQALADYVNPGLARILLEKD